MGIAAIIAPMENHSETQHRWVEQLLAYFSITQTDLARRARIVPSTLSKFMTGHREGHVLSARVVTAIETATGIKAYVDPTLSGPAARMPAPGFAEPDAAVWRPEGDAFGAAVAALRAGYAACDAWTLRTDALTGAGYWPGDILLVDLNGVARPGDVVVAQTIDFAGHTMRTVFRLFEPPYLVEASSDPRRSKPILVDNAGTQVRGVVVAALRRRPGEAAASGT